MLTSEITEDTNAIAGPQAAVESKLMAAQVSPYAELRPFRFSYSYFVLCM